MKHADLLWHGHQLRLSRLLASRRYNWLLAWLIGQLAALAAIALLALAGWFITAAGLAGIVSLSSAYTFNYLIPSGIIRLLAIGRTAARYGERLTTHHAVLSLLADLRSSLFKRLIHHRTQSATSITQMHRLTSDIDLLNGWPLNVILPIGWMIISLVVFLLLIWLSIGFKSLMLLILPLTCASILLPWWAAYYGRRWGFHQANQAEQRRQALLQPLSVLTALLQWHQWPKFAQHFDQKDQIYLTAWRWQQRFCARIVWVQQTSLAITAGLLLYNGAKLITQHQLAIAWLLALLLALFGLVELILAVGRQIMTYGLCCAACQRLNTLVCVPENTPINKQPQSLPSCINLHAHQITARHIGALNGIANLSFKLNSGDTLIVKGGSGTGKSTLLAALAGEIPLQQGSITCLDLPMNHWQWQGQLAYLGQEVDIFDLTLAENLRLGKADATDAELWQALELVALADWAHAQPQQLATPLGEYGYAVSGGQARRIALARLLLKPYTLMLLDEPFAGLDTQTTQQLVTMLTRQQHGILIMVSHQPITISQAKVLTIT